MCAAFCRVYAIKFYFLVNSCRFCQRRQALKETGAVEDGFPGPQPSAKPGAYCQEVRRVFWCVHVYADVPFLCESVPEDFTA